jgi:U4/U6 small nuclear ribonucleoprotein PRP31
MKERLGMTELRKKANRTNFGELMEDVMQDKMGFSLGQVKSGPAAGGRLRGPTADQKSRARMSQKLQKTMQKQNQASGGVTSVRSKIAGTASSVTFTPVQGLEIVNPMAMEKKVANANATYFSATAGFVKVQTPMPGAKKDS